MIKFEQSEYLLTCYENEYDLFVKYDANNKISLKNEHFCNSFN